MIDQLATSIVVGFFCLLIIGAVIVLDIPAAYVLIVLPVAVLTGIWFHKVITKRGQKSND